HFISLDALRDFMMTGDKFQESKYTHLVDEMKKSLAWLEVNVRDKHQLKLIKSIHEKLLEQFTMADKATQMMAEGGSIEELAGFMKQKGEFGRQNETMVPVIRELLDAQKREQARGPDEQKKFRETAKKFLFAGVILNVVAAFMMAAFFTRSIIS